MPEAISIKERVERRIAEVVGAVSGVASVERWQASGNTRDAFSALIIAEDESCDEGGSGGDTDGLTTTTLLVRVELLVAQRHDETDSSSHIHNRWLARIEQAVMADPSLVEPATGEALAIDVRKAGSSNPPVEDDQTEFFTIIDFEVIYDTYRSNPYEGPGITERQI